MSTLLETLKVLYSEVRSLCPMFPAAVEQEGKEQRPICQVFRLQSQPRGSYSSCQTCMKRSRSRRFSNFVHRRPRSPQMENLVPRSLSLVPDNAQFYDTRANAGSRSGVDELANDESRAGRSNAEKRYSLCLKSDLMQGL